MWCHAKFVVVAFILPSMSAISGPQYEGYWAVKCGGFGGSVNIKASKDVEVNINDNNLFISASLQPTTKGRYHLLYQGVIESTNGVIFWDNISKKRPIADVFFEGKSMNIKWNGFYDLKKNRYIWRKEPDFVIASDDNSHIRMQKCTLK
ncbi:hypothetical protein ACMS1V_002489 [Cronobacter dublinensis]